MQIGDILKQSSRGRKGPQFVDPEFVEALYGDNADHPSSHHQNERKAQQYCRQVQRALNLALADSDGIDDLFIEEVVPAPDCGRLLVHVVIPTGRSAFGAMAALRAQAPRLRSEVASTISRKRAPELSFAPVCPAGGWDE